MEEQAVIDRIEEGRLAVLLVGEAQTERGVPLDQLPAGARAGTWLKLRLDGDRLVDAQLDVEATRHASARIEAKMERLRQPSEAGTYHLMVGVWSSDSQVRHMLELVKSHAVEARRRTEQTSCRQDRPCPLTSRQPPSSAATASSTASGTC